MVVSALPISACAQGPVASTSTPVSSDQPAAVGGLPALDVIELGNIGPGAPLRYGNVIPNSEMVQLGGIRLHLGTDYLMDYGVGVVYLMVAQSAGQELTVAYRYKQTAPIPAGGIVTSPALSASTYTLMPGALSLLTDFGVIERGSGGTVASSNLLGVSDNFKLGDGVSLNGLYMIGYRQNEANFPGMAFDPTQFGPATGMRGGDSQLIVQDMKISSFLGGTANIYYQNISGNFMGISSLPGTDAATAARLNAERGLTRFGADVDGMKLGSFTVSDSFKDVKDCTSGIYWNQFNAQNGGFNLNYSQQQVDNHFSRFKDIAEVDRTQLSQEAGMTRQNLAVDYAQEFGKISYEGTKVTDNISDTSVKHEDWAALTPQVRLDVGDEQVDAGFSRFGGLLPAEQIAYDQEAGIRRQWLGLQSTVLGDNTPFSYTQSSISMPGGEFVAEDAAIGGPTWDLQYVNRNIGSGFTDLGAMSPAESAANVASIGKMYGPGATPGGGDQAEFMSESGIQRQFTDLTTDVLKGWNINASDLALAGMHDTGRVDSISAASSNVTVNVRHEDLGSRFDEIATMMDLETLRLGDLAGLSRTDADVSVQNGHTHMDVNAMQAETGTGNVTRETASYDDPNKLDVQVGARSVSPGFQDAESLTDPDKQLLDSLRGFGEQDMKVGYAFAPGSRFDTFDEQQYNPFTHQYWTTNNTVLDTMVNKNTEFNLTDLEQHNDDPYSTIFSSVVRKMSVVENMGGAGILKVLEESDQFGGFEQSQFNNQTDYLGYQNSLSATTTFKTEETHTVFANGQTENIESNGIAQMLDKRTGVSVSDTEVQRTGATEESHPNAGVWYDLGNNIKVSYGYMGNIMPDGQQSSSSQGFMIGKAPPGPPQNSVQAAQVGNLMFDGGYSENQWAQSDRTQTNGNIMLASAKPFRLGAFQDVMLNVNLDSGSDYSRLTHQDKLFQAQGKYSQYLIGVEYKSQMDPFGNTAIDKTVKLQTDPSDKKFITGAASYKERTMPDDSVLIIRDYNLTMRPTKNVTVVNLLQTNPDVANPGVLLGSMPAATRSDKWTLDYKTDPNLTVGAAYQELINDEVGTACQTAGVTMKLFSKSGSPVSLFYGLEDADQTDLWRKTQRYSIEFDQKPGPNQTFTLFVGNVSYLHNVPVSQATNNNTLRVNYQYRF